MSEPTPPPLFLAPVLGFVLLFALVPVSLLFGEAVLEAGGAGGIAQVISDPLNRQAAENSLLQGALSAVGAFALGYPAGVFIGRTRFRGRGLLEGLLLVPFLLPAIVVVLAVQDVVGPGTLLARTSAPLGLLGTGVGGVIAVNIVFNLPLVVLLTAVGVRSAHGRLEESLATLGATPLRAFRDVWGAPSLLGALSGSLLTFLFSALAFAPPLLLCGARCSTLEVRVWSLANVLLDPRSAAILAFGLVLLLALPTALYLGLIARLHARSGEGRQRPFDARDPVAWALGVETAVVAGAIAVVLGGVLARAIAPTAPGGPWAPGFAALLAPRVAGSLGIGAGSALANTLLFASASACLALLFGVLAGYVRVERPRSALAAQFTLYVPLLLSPVVLAFALAQFWRPTLGGASASWLLIVLSETTLALPFALGSLGLALGRLSAGTREAARLLGARPFRSYVDADLPRAGGAVLTAGLFAFALGLGEFTATYFLAPPQFSTLPVLLYNLEGVRQYAAASGAAAVLLVASLGVFFALSIGGRRVEL